MPKLGIIVASTRPGRIGPVIAEWIEAEAKEHAGFAEVELIDLAELDLPFMNEPHHPRLVLQRQLGEWVAAAFVVAEAGLVLSSAAEA